MAERIDTFTPLRGRRPIYPWHEWMDGSAWRIRRGEDFEVSPLRMSERIRERGRRHGVAVSASVDGDTVEFQFSEEATRAA